MWRITKISNARHEVTITHKDGDEHAFVIPEEHRATSDTKGSFIVAKMKEQTDIKKAAETKEIKELTKVVVAKKRLPLPWILVAIQAAVMAAMFLLLKAHR